MSEERKTITVVSPNSREVITLYIDSIAGYGYDEFGGCYLYALNNRFGISYKDFVDLGGELPKHLKDAYVKG